MGTRRHANNINSKSFTCGHCGFLVASAVGFRSNHSGIVYICPHCDNPTFFDRTHQIAGVAPGNVVESLPSDIQSLYNEARNCVASGANTAAALVCRKLLAHLAVSQGAAPGKNFLDYVQYLAANGFVPPNGKGWVDHIRKKGNEATHEIIEMTTEDAKDLVSFLEMLLKFIYEFPNRISAQPRKVGS